MKGMRNWVRVAGWMAAAIVACLPAGSSEAAKAPDVVPKWPDLSRGNVMQRVGSADAAVLVGIGRYRHLPPVAGADRTATEWRGYLLESRAARAGRVILLVDAAAGREAILDACGKAVREVGEGGVLWFVFIGHAWPGPDGNTPSLIGHDAPSDRDDLARHSVRLDEIYRAILPPSGRRTVVVVDASLSGLSGPRPGESLWPDGRTTDDGPVVPSPPSGVTLFLGAVPGQYAGYLPGLDRPAASWLLLGALRGWADADRHTGNQDGQVTAVEALRYQKALLIGRASDRFQEPVLFPPDERGVLAVGAFEAGPATGPPPPVLYCPPPPPEHREPVESVVAPYSGGLNRGWWLDTLVMMVLSVMVMLPRIRRPLYLAPVAAVVGASVVVFNFVSIVIPPPQAMLVGPFTVCFVQKSLALFTLPFLAVVVAARLGRHRRFIMEQGLAMLAMLATVYCVYIGTMLLMMLYVGGQFIYYLALLAHLFVSVYFIDLGFDLNVIRRAIKKDIYRRRQQAAGGGPA